MTYALKNPTGAPSEAAFGYLVKLIGMAFPEADKRRELLVKAAGFNAQQVSTTIDILKNGLAAKKSGGEAGAVQVTHGADSDPVKWIPGKYLVNGKTYVLKVGKGSGAAYLLTEGGTYIGAKKGDAPAVLAAIAKEGEALAVAYGQKTGVCGICSTTLTNPDSIAKGIGPVCAEKF